MDNRILPDPQLRAVASPGNYFARPGGASVRSSADSFLSGLSRLNPALQSFLTQANDDYIEREEAEGALAANGVEARQKIEDNRQGWRNLIGQVRKEDPEQADRIVTRSPHFRRGLYKAKAQRLGIGLSDHLQTLWSRNPEINGVPLHEVDDEQVVLQWLQNETEAYSERVGTSKLNPVILAEAYLPYVSRAQDGLLASHTNFRTNRYQQDYQDELSAGFGLDMSMAGTGDSEVDDFLNRLGMSENSGRWAGTNALGFTGKWQFGDDRIADYNRATGANISRSQLDDSPEGIAIQKQLVRWHIQDIDQVIDSEGYLDRGLSRDGLRAVAHLGGIGGMKRFVETNGEYNPHDGYTKKDGTKVKGTHLSDYYTKFASPLGEIQTRLDQAAADGINPRAANEIAVNSIIRHATATGDPAVLDIIDDIDTGTGKLGNIGWVKDKIAQASGTIADAQYKAEQRELKKEQTQRDEAKRMIHMTAMRELLTDPFADISEIVDQANASGNPDLASSLLSQQDTMIDRNFDVRPNHERIAQIRLAMLDGSVPEEELRQAILDEVGINFSGSVAMQLADDLENRDRNSDSFGDRQVQGTISDFGRVIGERFAVNDGFIRIAGTEKAIEAELLLRRDVADFIRETEDVTTADVREFAQNRMEKLLKSPLWQPTEQENPEAVENRETQRPFGAVAELQRLTQSPAEVIGGWDTDNLNPNQAAMLQLAAGAANMTVAQWLQANGISFEQVEE